MAMGLRLRLKSHGLWLLAVVSICLNGSHSLVQAEAAISFKNQVMPILAKAGCNLGTCHGGARGKGGFKLSLRGESPELDFLALTQEFGGRRINRTLPERSLILLKATAAVAHEGSQRFTKISEEFEALSQWIFEGADSDLDSAPQPVAMDIKPAAALLTHPVNTGKLQAWVSFDDRSTRDLTRWTVFEPTVAGTVEVDPEGNFEILKPGFHSVIARFLNLQRPVEVSLAPQKPDFRWSGPDPQNEIDEWIFAKQRQLNVRPSEICSDSEFIRRASLDLLGRLPTPKETEAFLGSANSHKRSQWSASAMERPEFASFWALKWSDLLRNEEKTLDRKGSQSFHRWIQKSIADNRPLNEFVQEILAASGSSYQNPAANFYRAVRDPIERAESTAQLFLGKRLKCAQCHNHPFDRWTQDDYFGWAGWFTQVDYKVLENRRKDSNDQHEFVGNQVVWMKGQGGIRDPRDGSHAQPALLGATPQQTDQSEDRQLERLAKWVTSKENPWFAKAQANRVWYHLMGKGLVDPIDDLRPTNPPTHPEALNFLTHKLLESDFNLRALIQTIMESATYQLSSVPNEDSLEEFGLYARRHANRMEAEVLLDGFQQVLGTSLNFAGYPNGLRATQIPGAKAFAPRYRKDTAADQFLEFFGKPPRLLSCECERTDETTLSQAFQLMSGDALNQLIRTPENRLRKWVEYESPRAVIQELYQRAFARAASEGELKTLEPLLSSAWDVVDKNMRRQVLEDVVWATLNSKEFLTNH